MSTATHDATAARYAELQALHLNLDLTRGKPSAAQLDAGEALDDVLKGRYTLDDGTDLRNYGGLDGIAPAKALGGMLMDVPASSVLVGGNSSLTLMYHFLLLAHLFGLRGPESAWSKQPGPAKFLCPVPGYDRHFAICETLGIEMVPVAMNDDGPVMDEVEALVEDPQVIGLWCVPKYANPSGCVYSADTVKRLARLGLHANPLFRILYDNAYAAHDLDADPPPLASLWQACEKHGTLDSAVHFGSTSKMTLAGSGIAFMAASADNLAAMKKHLSILTIGPDKLNQQRHALLLPDRAAVDTLMAKHAALVRPKFERVLDKLRDGLGNRQLGRWTEPRGGYFVSYYAPPGLASEIVKLAAEAGVKLTAAGAAYPYGKDPDDSHIRLAPTYPTLDELDQAMDVFIACVKLAASRSGRAV